MVPWAGQVQPEELHFDLFGKLEIDILIDILLVRSKCIESLLSLFIKCTAHVFGRIVVLEHKRRKVDT